RKSVFTIKYICKENPITILLAILKKPLALFFFSAIINLLLQTNVHDKCTRYYGNDENKTFSVSYDDSQSEIRWLVQTGGKDRWSTFRAVGDESAG
ncbi:MAG: hypothetical protein IIU56_00735, partial [Peptococcaceae bacterium]|nr:hypothetical protein [Peptococcaceae bacterium]